MSVLIGNYIQISVLLVLPPLTLSYYLSISNTISNFPDNNDHNHRHNHNHNRHNHSKPNSNTSLDPKQETIYTFLHDRIQEAAYSLLEAESKPKVLHSYPSYRIAILSYYLIIQNPIEWNLKQSFNLIILGSPCNWSFDVETIIQQIPKANER